MRISEGWSCVRGKEMTLQQMEDPGKISFGANGLGFSLNLKDHHLFSLSKPVSLCKTILAMITYFSLKINYVK